MEKIIDEMLKKPYWIIDVLPKQVPPDSRGQYFAVEKYFLEEERLAEIKQKHINLILKLNCYYHVTLLDEKYGEPSPEEIDRVMRERALYIMIDKALIFSEPDSLYMTVYGPNEELLKLIKAIAAGEGMFVWNNCLHRL